MITDGKVRVRRESMDKTIGRLHTYIQRFERRYECRSETMVKAVARKKVRETAEISRWLNAYESLRNLKSRRRSNGRMTGTPTATT